MVCRILPAEFNSLLIWTIDYNLHMLQYLKYSMPVQLLSFQVFKYSIDQNVEKFGFD